MNETDVRITDLDLLSSIDSGDFFAVVETGAVNKTRKVEFDSISGQINDPLSGFVVSVSGELQTDINSNTTNLAATGANLATRINTTGSNLATRINTTGSNLATSISTTSGNLATSISTTSGNLATSISTTSGDLANRMMYTIFCEESDPLDANSHEWSFGNGDNPPASNGIPIVFDSKLIGLGLDIERGTAGDITVEVFKDGTTTTLSVTASNSDETATVNTLDHEFLAGTKINFKTTTLNGTANSGRIIAYLRTV